MSHGIVVGVETAWYECHPDVPEIGSPEFREFTRSPRWMELVREQASKDGREREEGRAQQLQQRTLEAETPVLLLGATGICSPKVWSRDFRERLPIDDPDRMDYEESIYGKSEAELMAEDVERLGKLHEVALKATIVY